MSIRNGTIFRVLTGRMGRDFRLLSVALILAVFGSVIADRVQDPFVQ